MPNLLPILAEFLTTAQGAYPDLDVLDGESCVHLRWGSHTLTAWVDLDEGSMTITHDEGSHEADGGPDPLATVAQLIVEHLTEVGYDAEHGEGHRDAEPGTFAARVWVTLYQARIARLDPEGRYSVKEPEPLIINDYRRTFDPDDTLF